MTNELFKHEVSKLQGIKIIDYLQSLNINDIDNRREFFANLSIDQFIEILNTITKLLRNTNEPVNFDGNNITSAGINPFFEDKKRAIYETLITAQHFLNNNDLTSKEALIFTGITIYNGITITHPYLDANGRLSRIISYLIINGSPSIEIFNNLIKGARADITWNFDVGRNFENHDKTWYNIEQPDYIKINNYKLFNNEIFLSLGEMRLLIEENINDYDFKTLMNKHTSIKEGKTTLDAEEFIKELVNTKKTDIKTLGMYLKRLLHFSRLRGFLNAMISDSPKTIDDNFYFKSEPFNYEHTTGNSYLDEYVNKQASKKDRLLKILTERYGITSLPEFEQFLSNIPLREQLYYKTLIAVDLIPDLGKKDIEEKSISK